ncbi:MAG: hypothetical protein ABJ308_17865 [Halieaceae bacterium]
MTKFEFIAVLLSIIFGLGLTNLLSGMLRAFFKRELTDTRLAWSIVIGTLLLVDWWMLFRWSDHTDWRFHEFLYLVAWSTVHYLMAVSLYPYGFLTEYSEELQRKFVLTSIMAMSALDVGEKIVLGTLFEPWYYLVMITYIVVFAGLPLLIPRPQVMRACGWILAVSVIAWSVVVRSALGG